MTMQEVFDKVATHLMTQGCRSVQGTAEVGRRSTCLYRGPNGTKCAVGCLISDEAYSPTLEEKPVEATNVLEALARSGLDVFDSTLRRLLRELQTVHDSVPVANWAQGLAYIAKQYGLAPPALPTV
jgi:hypothetical protein